jgi:hypothetical protein
MSSGERFARIERLLRAVDSAEDLAARILAFGPEHAVWIIQCGENADAQGYSVLAVAPVHVDDAASTWTQVAARCVHTRLPVTTHDDVHGQRFDALAVPVEQADGPVLGAIVVQRAHRYTDFDLDEYRLLGLCVADIFTTVSGAQPRRWLRATRS